MNGHGGKRPGAGRPKGAASRANEQVREEAAATGELPLAYTLRIMRDPSQPVGRRDDMAKAAAPFELKISKAKSSSVRPAPHLVLIVVSRPDRPIDLPASHRSSRGVAPARDGPSTRQRSFRADRHGRPIRRASRPCQAPPTPC